MNKSRSNLVIPDKAKLKPLINTSAFDAEDGSILELHGYDAATKRFQVRRPTANGINPAKLIIAYGRIAANGEGMGLARLPSRILFDPADGDPATGDAYGTTSGSFRLKQGMFGFRAIAGTLVNNSCLFLTENNCSGSAGSGSSSDISQDPEAYYCCGCPRFTCGTGTSSPDTTWPTDMELTVTNSVLGTRTLNLDVIPFDAIDGPVACGQRFNPNDTHGGIRARYTGSYNGTFFDEATWTATDCQSGAGSTGMGYVDEQLAATLTCCDTTNGGNAFACLFFEQLYNGEPYESWTLEVSWTKHIAGVRHSMAAYIKMTIVACSPFSLTRSGSVGCKLTHPGSLCGQDPEDDPIYITTSDTPLSGSTFQADLEEV